MNPQIDKMFSDAEGRYLEPVEQAAIIEYANSLEHRLAAMREIQEKEAGIVSACVDAMLEDDPGLYERHVEVREKAIRDMTLVLRCCAAAMVRDSEVYLKQRILSWFRTILVAFDMQQVVQTAYVGLHERCGQELDPNHFALLSPYLELTIQELSKPQ
jgi:hypothetical protein